MFIYPRVYLFLGCLVIVWLIIATSSTFALDLPPVDPDSDTDNTINQFLLDEVRQGRTKTIAGGGWWGPTDRFATNQLWGITESASGLFPPGGNITGRVACLRPGGGNGFGTAQNTLLVYNVIFNNARHRYAERALQNGEFVTLESRGLRNIAPGKTDPVRTQCFSRENVADIFANGSPVAGAILRTGVKIPWWFATEKPVLDNTPAGFNVMGTLVRSGTLKSVPIAAQAWYQRTGYHYTVLDSAIDDAGQLIAAADLAGATLHGTIRLHWYALRGAREESHGTGDFQHEIHHMELRVEEGGEDYTYAKVMANAQDQPLSNENYKEMYTDLDTRILSDGWHIISFHSHAIDHVTTGAGRDMQLAAELKVPVCVANSARNACADGANPGVPTATPIPTFTPNPPIPTATPVVPQPPNLLLNGDFSQGLTDWQWYDGNGDVPMLDGNTILLPQSDNQDAQLYQRGIQLVSQQRYLLKISVQARSDDAELGLFVHSHDAPYTSYGLRRTFPVGTMWTTLEIPFRAKNFEGITNDARFRIRPIRGAIRIDTVHLMVDNSTLGDALDRSKENETALQLADSAGMSGESGFAIASATTEVTDNVADGIPQLFLPLVTNP